MTTELSEKDLKQLEIEDRLRRISELHSYSRSLLGLNPLPMRARLRNRVQTLPGQMVYESAPQGAPVVQGERRIFGFGIIQNLGDNIRGLTQARRPQVSPEDLAAAGEQRRQLLEDAARRKAHEEEAAEKARNAEALERARRGMSVMVEG